MGDNFSNLDWDNMRENLYVIRLFGVIRIYYHELYGRFAGATPNLLI